MAKENVSLDFRLKNRWDKLSFRWNKIRVNEWKAQKIMQSFKFLWTFPIFSGCVSISAFASFVSIPAGITSSAVGLKICVITAGVKNYKSIIMKKKA